MRARAKAHRTTRFAATLLASVLPTLSCGIHQRLSSVTGAPRRPPDEQFSSGGGITVVLASWRCLDGVHVVMVERCYDGFPGGCDPWITDRSACGTQTPLEARVMAEHHPSPTTRENVW
jgi:hypothetical protein